MNGFMIIIFKNKTRKVWEKKEQKRLKYIYLILLKFLDVTSGFNQLAIKS